MAATQKDLDDFNRMVATDDYSNASKLASERGYSAQDVANDAASVLGKQWNGTEFVTKPDTNTYLHITTPTNPLAINTNITVNVAIKDANGNIFNVSGTYYVPVVQKVSNVSVDLLDINIVNGEATKTFQISAKGIYSIVISAISPLPTSILADNVELIVI